MLDAAHPTPPAPGPSSSGASSSGLSSRTASSGLSPSGGSSSGESSSGASSSKDLPLHPETVTPSAADSTDESDDGGDSGASVGVGGVTDPWRILRRQQDRRRYLRILTPPRTGKEKPRRPSPVTGMARSSHHLLGAPASMTRSATNFPNAEHVRQYLKHSADLTMRGGTAAAVAYAPAVCALAEHYVFRRIAGSSAGAAVAAATAAAELGRTAPDPTRTVSGQDLAVSPGFAGLADVTGWLTAQDVAGQDSASLAAGQPLDWRIPDNWPEQHRLTRLFQPSGGTRATFRLIVALIRARDAEPSRRRDHLVPVVMSLLAALPTVARAVTAVLWAGALVGWGGFSVLLARTAGLPWPVLALASAVLLVTVVVAAAAGTAVACALAVRTLLLDRADAEHFGLVPGVATGDDLSPRATERAYRLDDLAGVPEADGVPPLVTWLADRIDDLAGVPRAEDGGAQHTDRYALTFGELWLGRIGPRTTADTELLRRAANDVQLRTIDLALVTTNLSHGRPYSLPFMDAERADRAGSSRFLFCRTCLTAVLPMRVVAQMILLSPAQATEATCPRHPGDTLHEVPDPWDFPVIAAVRLSMATPGLLRAVPLYTLDQEVPGALYDEYGAQVLAAAPSSGVFVPRTHWFCDGGVTSDVGVHHFDTLLPRWPTFGLSVADVASAPRTEGGRQVAEWLTVPAQDASHRPRVWRRVVGLRGFAEAVVGASVGWRDAMQADMPGFRGRLALVRAGSRDGGGALFLEQAAALRLATRGYHAGLTLRERFTGPDGDSAGQTQTDRYRWIRLRMAMREYRALSLEIGARLPLYSDLAASYKVPSELVTWFTPPLTPGTTDPAWPDAAAAVTHLRALSAGGVLDWDTEYGAPPVDTDLRLSPYE